MTLGRLKNKIKIDKKLRDYKKRQGLQADAAKCAKHTNIFSAAAAAPSQHLATVGVVLMKEVTMTGMRQGQGKRDLTPAARVKGKLNLQYKTMNGPCLWFLA